MLVVLAVSGCGSAPPPPPAAAARPIARPFENVRRIAVVASGEPSFSVKEYSAEPGRTFQQIIKWGWVASVWQPVAELVHQGINWLLEFDRKSDASAGLTGVSPKDTVTEAFVAGLLASGQYDEVSAFTHEPVGEDRRRADAIVRLSVPAWGVVRVREGQPDLHSAFVDVRAEMVLRGSGVVVWERSEDVTGLERFPLDSLTRERDLTREQMLEVLKRAGQRLASELLYGRSAGR
jgi:hypothetical protein